MKQTSDQAHSQAAMRRFGFQLRQGRKAQEQLKQLLDAKAISDSAGEHGQGAASNSDRSDPPSPVS